MASPEPTSATLTVGDIAAFADTELAEFMKKHRRPNGDFDLPVDGWDQLSKDERDQLAERLKAQERALARSPTSCSRPLDLDALDARLRDVADGDNSLSTQDPPRLRARRRTETPPDWGPIRRKNETRAYYDLINDGSRPLYPIDRLEQVFQSPDNYREMIDPWRDRLRLELWQSFLNRQGPWPEPWELFQRQLARWQDFRRWQNNNRDIEDDGDGGFLSYVERTKAEMKLAMRQDAYVEWLAKKEADASSFKEVWAFVEIGRIEQQNRCAERGCDGFLQYAEAVKRRLAQHNFTRPFHLHEDPKQQDKLTTWIEYLNFEYWWLDRHTRVIERLKTAHDKAWQELVDLKVLRPNETQESVRTDAFVMERQVEEDQAREAVKRAKSEAGRVYQITQEDPQRLRIPKAKRISMLAVATINLNAAKGRLKSIKERNDRIEDFILDTHDYVGAKKDTARQDMLVQWVLEQVPLIEAEMTQTEAREAGSNVTNRMKRRLNTDEDDPEKPAPKRQMLDQQERSHPASGPASNSVILPEAREAHPRSSSMTDQYEGKFSQIKRSTTSGRPRWSGNASPATPQGLRRSARIAARQNSPGTALATDTSRP
ncbi:hypothetical protein QQX98_012997 [Neonectria punicea]|uniref:Uncharacterized protein n=1 Tax=Neonectria punicea TaxID=979145 RepID=A0ABR1GHD3_9HYPO